jgi:predicted nucleic acid-binding protein
MKNNENHIFVDTNCLISYLADKYGLRKNKSEENIMALRFLFGLNGKKLYISSLSIAQLTATLQKKIGANNMMEEVSQLIHRFNIVEFNENDIKAALNNQLAQDIEDLYQYEMSQKVKCFYVMTNNLRDFSSFANIVAFSPKKVRKIIF